MEEDHLLPCRFATINEVRAAPGIPGADTGRRRRNGAALVGCSMD